MVSTMERLICLLHSNPEACVTGMVYLFHDVMKEAQVLTCSLLPAMTPEATRSTFAVSAVMWPRRELGSGVSRWLWKQGPWAQSR